MNPPACACRLPWDRHVTNFRLRPAARSEQPAAAARWMQPTDRFGPSESPRDDSGTTRPDLTAVTSRGDSGRHTELTGVTSRGDSGRHTELTGVTSRRDSGVGGHRILPSGGHVGLPTDGHSTAVSDWHPDVPNRYIPARRGTQRHAHKTRAIAIVPADAVHMATPGVADRARLKLLLDTLCGLPHPVWATSLELTR